MLSSKVRINLGRRAEELQRGLSLSPRTLPPGQCGLLVSSPAALDFRLSIKPGGVGRDLRANP